MHRVSLTPGTTATDDMREQAADRLCNGAVDRMSRPQSEDLTPPRRDHQQQQNHHHHHQQKGGYTTSIVVNSSPRQGPVVTVHQRQPSVVTVRHSLSQETGSGGGSSGQARQHPGGLANTFPRPVSETHESMHPTVLQKRYSNLADGKSHRHQNGGGGGAAAAASKHHKGVPNGTGAPDGYHHDNSRERTHTADIAAFSRGDQGARANHAHPQPEHVSPGASRPASQHQPHLPSAIPVAPPLTASVFAGRRDVKDPSSVREKEIVSSKGTVRGFKNRVRAGIATFWAQAQDTRNYRLLEQGKIIVYATSMSVVRETSERCKIVRSLLHNHMVRYEERDLYMSRDLQQELRDRLAQEGITELHLPHVFADGIHLGSSEELEKLNEAGELRQILDTYQKIVVRIMCDKCGGYRYVPCDFCHGSKKSLLRNHFTEEFCALRCMHCDDNGLRRCDMCIDQQE